MSTETWIVHHCCDCDTEITDPRFQSLDQTKQWHIRCDTCAEKSREKHREDRWKRD